MHKSSKLGKHRGTYLGVIDKIPQMFLLDTNLCNLYKNNSNCINLCQGGTFGGATPKTEKWRRAIKKALCGKKQTQEHKDKVKKQLIKNREIFREKAKKQWENPEFRRKMSEIRKRLWATEEFRRKNAEGWAKRKKD